MNNSSWNPVEYDKVNQLRNNNRNNDPHIQSYSMISPSDVPSHYLLDDGETYLHIQFKYLYENEKKTEESIINNSIIFLVGKNSKKIYDIRIHKKNLNEALKSIDSIEPHVKEKTKNKVKTNSYSAVKEIYNEYIKDFLGNGLRPAF